MHSSFYISSSFMAFPLKRNIAFSQSSSTRTFTVRYSLRIFCLYPSASSLNTKCLQYMGKLRISVYFFFILIVATPASRRGSSSDKVHNFSISYLSRFSKLTTVQRIAETRLVNEGYHFGVFIAVFVITAYDNVVNNAFEYHPIKVFYNFVFRSTSFGKCLTAPERSHALDPFRSVPLFSFGLILF